MSKFIVGTFLILGWTFYELSGGSDFAVEEVVVAEAIPAEEEVVPITVADVPAVEVTRAEPTDLLEIASAEVLQPSSNVAEVVSVQEDVVADSIASALIEPIIVEPTHEEVSQPLLDIRIVTGTRVNMRAGPGTSYEVLDTLPGGTEAEVIVVNIDGWARIRIIETDQIGWMAERLLTES